MPPVDCPRPAYRTIQFWLVAPLHLLSASCVPIHGSAFYNIPLLGRSIWRTEGAVVDYYQTAGRATVGSEAFPPVRFAPIPEIEPLAVIPFILKRAGTGYGNYGRPVRSLSAFHARTNTMPTAIDFEFDDLCLLRQ
jgi:hypothetical protein